VRGPPRWSIVHARTFLPRDMAQFGSAAALGADGCGFKSYYPDLALVTEWQTSCVQNAGFVGSTPTKGMASLAGEDAPPVGTSLLQALVAERQTH
jgi:hypothetical protein